MALFEGADRGSIPPCTFPTSLRQAFDSRATRRAVARLRVDGFHIWGSRLSIWSNLVIRRLRLGYYALSGTQNPEAFTEAELRNWGGEGWARSELGLVGFEIFRQAISKMRAKYPFVTLFVAKGLGPPPSSEYTELSPAVLQEHVHTELVPRFRFEPHGAFRRDNSGHYTAYLVDIGRGDFAEFSGFTRELSWFGVAFMLADRPGMPKYARGAMARAETGDELVHLLLRFYGVLFFPDDEPDWVLLTRDKEVVRAILRGSTFQRPRYRSRQSARNVC